MDKNELLKKLRDEFCLKFHKVELDDIEHKLSKEMIRWWTEELLLDFKKYCHKSGDLKGFLDWSETVNTLYIDEDSLGYILLLLSKEGIIDEYLLKECELCAENLILKDYTQLIGDDMICECGKDNKFVETKNKDLKNKQLDMIYCLYKLKEGI